MRCHSDIKLSTPQRRSQDGKIGRFTVSVSFEQMKVCGCWKVKRRRFNVRCDGCVIGGGTVQFEYGRTGESGEASCNGMRLVNLVVTLTVKEGDTNGSIDW